MDAKSKYRQYEEGYTDFLKRKLGVKSLAKSKALGKKAFDKNQKQRWIAKYGKEPVPPLP